MSRRFTQPTVIGGSVDAPNSIAMRCGRCSLLTYLQPGTHDEVRRGSRVLCLRCAVKEGPDEPVQLTPQTIAELAVIFGPDRAAELASMTLDLTLREMVERLGLLVE